jgi:hypothetical protein
MLHDPLVVFALLVMALSAIYIVHSYWPSVPSRPSVNVLEEYVKAVMHLNKSTLAVEAKLAGYSVSGIGLGLEEAMSTRDWLREYVGNLSRVYASEDNFLVGVARSYLHVAEGATNSTLAFQALNNTADALRESLGLLAECRIDEALEKYGGVELEVLMALSQMARADYALKMVNKGLVAENHAQVIDASHERLKRSLNSLYNAALLMGIARQYKDVLKALCSGRLPGGKGLLNSMLNDASNVSASGPLAPDIMNARNAIMRLIQENMPGQRGQQGSGQGSTGGVGGGAGYVPPSSDD